MTACPFDPGKTMIRVASGAIRPGRRDSTGRLAMVSSRQTNAFRAGPFPRAPVDRDAVANRRWRSKRRPPFPGRRPSHSPSPGHRPGNAPTQNMSSAQRANRSSRDGATPIRWPVGPPTGKRCTIIVSGGGCTQVTQGVALGWANEAPLGRRAPWENAALRTADGGRTAARRFRTDHPSLLKIQSMSRANSAADRSVALSRSASNKNQSRPAAPVSTSAALSSNTVAASASTRR